MIVQERMAVYINSLDTGNGPFLDALQRQALQDEVPIIRQDMQSFLKVLLAVHQKDSGSWNSGRIFCASDGRSYVGGVPDHNDRKI